MAYNAAERPLGGGQVEIALWDEDTPPVYPTDYENIGDIQSLSVQPKVTTISGYTSNFGVKQLDSTDPILTEYEIKFKLGQINQDILSLFLLGTKVSTNEVTPMTNLSQYYAIKFTPAYVKGLKFGHHFWKVRLTPSSALNLINPDKYGEVEFTGTGLIDQANHPTNPFWEVLLPTE